MLLVQMQYTGHFLHIIRVLGCYKYAVFVQPFPPGFQLMPLEGLSSNESILMGRPSVCVLALLRSCRVLAY